jgi:hypothetical protein
MANLDKPKIPEKGKPLIDVIFAVILLIAMLSSAFCVYQATRWNGIQSIDFGESAKFRTESIRATILANSEVIIDVQLFTSWVNAISEGDQAQAAFLKERFREEFRPAFDAWIAKGKDDPINPFPTGTPFDLPEFNISNYNESHRLEEKAKAAFDRGKEANTNGDTYISHTVLFAIVLFFCGIYSRWKSTKIHIAMLIITLLIFCYALYSVANLLLKVGYA